MEQISQLAIAFYSLLEKKYSKLLGHQIQDVRRWNEFKENLSNTFGSLKDNPDFSDVTLACLARMVCKVCGKEGFVSQIKDHIERSHLEGFIVACDQCEKTYTSRTALKRHHQMH